MCCLYLEDEGPEGLTRSRPCPGAPAAKLCCLLWLARAVKWNRVMAQISDHGEGWEGKKITVCLEGVMAQSTSLVSRYSNFGRG